ncbi:MAG: hypothetical protein ABGX20_02250 [Bacillus sp. (in: firmicutes)]
MDREPKSIPPVRHSGRWYRGWGNNRNHQGVMPRMIVGMVMMDDVIIQNNHPFIRSNSRL